MGKAVSSIFGMSSPKKPKTVVMPEADDAAIKAAKKRSVAAQRDRGGRASTILSESDKLGA